MQGCRQHLGAGRWRPVLPSVVWHRFSTTAPVLHGICIHDVCMLNSLKATPSFSSDDERLNLLQMEMEMEQLSRAFGMPSFFGGPTTALFDMMPAAELPTTMPTMTARSLVSRTAAGLVCEAHTLAHLTGGGCGARQHC